MHTVVGPGIFDRQLPTGECAYQTALDSAFTDLRSVLKLYAYLNTYTDAFGNYISALNYINSLFLLSVKK